MDEDDFLAKYSPEPAPTKNDASSGIPKTTGNQGTTEANQPTMEFSFDIARSKGSSPLSEEEKQNQSASAWVSPGKDITINRYNIYGGMVYVGTELNAVQGYGGGDACLIDPSLETDPTRLDPDGTRMSYWPSYTNIDPGCRATYLEWLANGRRDPDFDIGYVFLFFYGIERRVLFDAQHSSEARSEIPHLISEVEELLEVYSENNSFQSYATQLLDIARARYNPEALATATPLQTGYRREIPLGLRVKIGRQLVNGDPIDPELAYEWFQQAPNTYLRTPAERCEDEFRTLFLARYEDCFDGGLSREPNKTTLTVGYRPASRSLPQQDDIEIEGLPDISALSAPQRQLQELANECCDELDSYSRHVGKTQDRDSLEALALLPKPVFEQQETDSLTKFLQTIDSILGTSNMAETDLDPLLEHWFIESGKEVRERDLRRLARLLEMLGFGIEPDVRFSTPSRGWGDPAVLFRLPSERGLDEYEVSDAIRLIQKLAIKVALANNEVAPEQTEYLAENLGSFLELSEVDQARLNAHRRWLILDSPTLHGVRSRAEDLRKNQKTQIAEFLTALACSDGEIDSQEIQELSKIYLMIGLEEGMVHRHLHQLQIREIPSADEPVAIRKSEQTSDEYEIPKPRQTTEHQSTKIELDRDQVLKTLKDTKEVSEFLTDIFEEENDLRAKSLEEEPVSTADQNATQDLSEDHRQFLIKLSQKTHWNREEVEKLARESNLFPGAAIETINDHAYEQVEAPVVEGSEELIVDQELSNKILQ